MAKTKKLRRSKSIKRMTTLKKGAGTDWRIGTIGEVGTGTKLSIQVRMAQVKEERKMATKGGKKLKKSKKLKKLATTTIKKGVESINWGDGSVRG
jgi:hypothetical protein